MKLAFFYMNTLFHYSVTALKFQLLHSSNDCMSLNADDTLLYLDNIWHVDHKAY